MFIIGRHCCLWCLSSAQEMQLPEISRSHIQTRSLSNLKEHLQSFRDAGSNPKSAKNHFNVIDEVHFNIPIDQVKK